jgi:hypothetical protein
MALQKTVKKTFVLSQMSIPIGTFVTGPLEPNPIKLFLAKCVKKLAKK